MSNQHFKVMLRMSLFSNDLLSRLSAKDGPCARHSLRADRASAAGHPGAEAAEVRERAAPGSHTLFF